MNAHGETRRHSAREFEAERAVFAAIAERAAAADAGEVTLEADLHSLARSGLLDEMVEACLPGGKTLRAVALLRRLGRASLSVGRLVEGHANACKLVALYGSEDLLRGLSDPAPVHMGVWGADGTPPVRISRDTAKGRVVLSGRKRFCSGLGLLHKAVVLAETKEGPQMVLAEVSDAERADPADWQVSGMRATMSGGYDFEGVEARRLGRPGDVLLEPHFEGGVWRYLAVQTGAIEALAEAVRKHLRRRTGEGWAQNRERLLRVAASAHTARLWTQAAAYAVETPGARDEAVALSLAAREVVEEAARSALAIADRVLGTGSFRIGSKVEQIRRDLSFYLRQADLDGKVDRAASTILADRHPVGEQW